MKIGLAPVNIGIADPEMIIGLAQLAEGLGYESVWTNEHVMVPVDYDSKYPYNRSGDMGAPPEVPFIDPLIALTAMATHTKKLRLCTGVNILSQTNPLTLAKQAASLDNISKGRLILGLGIGWLREEFVAMGVPYKKRGARFDDYVQAMRKVWSGKVSVCFDLIVFQRQGPRVQKKRGQKKAVATFWTWTFTSVLQMLVSEKIQER